MSLGPYQEGLCGNREDHQAHMHQSSGLGIFWCHADQFRRLPLAAEKRREAVVR